MSEDPFIDLVEAEAQKLNKTFVINCGEGRTMPNPPDGMDVEDLSGWLLTPEQAATIPHWTRAERDALFEIDDLPVIFARWAVADDGGLSVHFEEAPPALDV